MRRVVIIFILVLGAFSTGLSPALAIDEPAEYDFISRINQERRARGLGELAVYWDLTDDARAHSDRMAAAGTIWHNPNLSSVTSAWYALAENVGMGPTVGSLHEAFMNSPGHRANILGNYNYLGVGATLDRYGTIYVTMVFMRGPAGLAPPHVPPFWDDDASPHQADIIKIWERAITAGCSAERYCPDHAVTRAQMATFLSRALGLPDGPDAFRDDNGHPLERYINALAASGITAGCSAHDFCPQQTVTRAQMATFLSRARGLNGGGDAFWDDNGHLLEPYINSLAASGITAGCAPGRFCPDAPVTRAQMATFLSRAFGY